MAGLLTRGSSPDRRPSQFPSGRLLAFRLTAYSCGGSRGIERRRLHHVPFLSLAGTIVLETKENLVGAQGHDRAPAGAPCSCRLCSCLTRTPVFLLFPVSPRSRSLFAFGAVDRAPQRVESGQQRQVDEGLSPVAAFPMTPIFFTTRTTRRTRYVPAPDSRNAAFG